MKTFALFVALLLATSAFPQAPIDFLQAGRDFTNFFYDGKANDIWMKLSPEMKKIFNDSDTILGMRLRMKDEYGPESAVTDEKVTLEGEFIQYRRVVMFQRKDTPMTLQWTFDRNGIVVGFLVRSEVTGESHFLNYQDKVALRLPFKGNWLVLAGGRSVAENHHAGSVDQRFAADLMPIKHGRIFSDEGTRVEQYYCFGQAILSPGAGTVVHITEGIPDNPINAPLATQPAGNLVIIDHGNSEYSFLAHLKLGSIKVKAGDKVRAGQRIGNCGNSGNSPVPHLHIHMQNTPVLFEGEGLPMQFQNYFANKKFVNAGEPGLGQTIRNKKNPK